MNTVLNVIFCMASIGFWLINLFWYFIPGHNISSMKNWARRSPVLMSCIHAALWIIYPENSVLIITFFLWLGIVLIQFLPHEKK